MAGTCSDESAPVWYQVLTFGISLWLWDCSSSQHEDGEEARRQKKEERGEAGKETQESTEREGNCVREREAGNDEKTSRK